MPPFNSLGAPPLNIVLLSVCQAGVVGANDPGLPGDLLYPNGNVYSGVSSFPENQGVVIPSEDILVNQGGLRVQLFLEMLGAGGRLSQAAVAYEQVINGHSAEVSVFGDQNARARFVYEIEPTATPQYWRNI